MHASYSLFLLNSQETILFLSLILHLRTSWFLEFFKFMVMIMTRGHIGSNYKTHFPGMKQFLTFKRHRLKPKWPQQKLKKKYLDLGVLLSKSIWVNWCHLWNFLTFYCHFCVSDKSNILDFMSLSWALELSVKPAHHGLNCCCLSPPTMTRKMRQSDGWALRT